MYENGSSRRVELASEGKGLALPSIHRAVLAGTPTQEIDLDTLAVHANSALRTLAVAAKERETVFLRSDAEDDVSLVALDPERHPRTLLGGIPRQSLAERPALALAGHEACIVMTRGGAARSAGVWCFDLETAKGRRLEVGEDVNPEHLLGCDDRLVLEQRRGAVTAVIAVDMVDPGRSR